MHCVQRLDNDHYMPVIAGSCGRFVHPDFDRGCTVREMARLLGWPEWMVPVGPDPWSQIGKGIVPSVGTWLAEQVDRALDGYWGDTDWESKYDDKLGEWTGRVFSNDPIKPPEKVSDC